METVMRKALPLLAVAVVGVFAGLLLSHLRPVPRSSDPPDEIVVSLPTGGPDDEHGNESRTWQTLTVIPDRLEVGERGLWWVKHKRDGVVVANYRCRPATP